MASRTKNTTCYNDPISQHSDDNRNVKQVVEEQEQNQFKNIFYQKVQKIAEDLQIDISDVTSTSKSKWKKRHKGKR